MNDLVSVVVPIYGVEEYLKNCINSILKQSYINLEIILVNDGSPDKCGEICDEYSKIDNRVKVIHKKNGGLSDARNVGIEIATGKFITFIDSDDYISEDYIKLLLECLIKGQADISICKLKVTSNLQEKSLIENYETMEAFTSSEALKHMLYALKFSTSACGRMFKTDLFDDVRFPLNKYSEDLFTIYKTFVKASKIVFISKEAYFYYVREDSITNEKFSLKHMDTIYALQNIKTDIVDLDSRLYPAYKSQMIEAIARILRMKPPMEHIVNNELWYEVKNYRMDVLLDKEASKRVRCYAALLIIGPRFTGIIMKLYYNLKWHKSKKLKLR